MNDKPARNTIVVVSETSIKLISEEDKLHIERHGCILVEESWIRKSCSDGKFGLLEDAFPDYRLTEPFHDVNVNDFKQSLIHVVGDIPEDIEDNIRKTYHTLTDTMYKANVILSDYVTSTKLPQFSRTFSCWVIIKL